MTAPVPEFSRLIAIEPDMAAAGDAGSFAIAATAEERAALARRFDLLDLASLSASGRIDVGADGRRAYLSATFKAEVTQACVVTMAPVRAVIEESFTVVYDRDAGRDRIEPELDIDLDAEEPPDPLPEEGIDVGEAVAEHLGLALDPYPRAPGVVFETTPEEDDERPSPFAALGRLKKPEQGRKS